jgi:23S rRNA (adenine2503-C2)-methyltransferase
MEREENGPAGARAAGDPRPLARELDREGLEKALRPFLTPGGAEGCSRWLELALYQRGALGAEEIDWESHRWKEAAAQALRLEPLLHLEKEVRSGEDGSQKLLFSIPRLGAGERIEAVAIRRRGDLTLCVSSQVGCPLACEFCATGLLGLRANLTAGEILEQQAWAERRTGQRVTDVVFMGMGEPLLNYQPVLSAAYALANPRGPQISHRKIVISTAGVTPQVRRYVREGHRFPLFFSITSAIPEKRRRLMPIEEVYPLCELVEAIREYQRAWRRNRWVVLEYVAIPGENMGEEDITALGETFRGIPYILDVIPYNPTDGRFRAPSWAEVRQFTQALRRLEAPVKVRYSSGKKAGGGCGQLAAGEIAPPRLEGHLLAPPGIFSDLH